MKKYIVTERNTAGLKSGESLNVGDEVELTDKQAEARANKVKPLTVKPAQASPAPKPEAAPSKSSRKSRAE